MNMFVYNEVRKAIEARGAARTEDIATAVHLTYAQTHSRLRQYVEKGLIFRVGKGIYATSDKVKSSIVESLPTRHRRKKATKATVKLLVSCFNKMVTVK